MRNQRAIGGVRREIKAEIGANVPAGLIAVEDRILLVGHEGARDRRSRSDGTPPTMIE